MDDGSAGLTDSYDDFPRRPDGTFYTPGFTPGLVQARVGFNGINLPSFQYPAYKWELVYADPAFFSNIRISDPDTRAPPGIAGLPSFAQLTFWAQQPGRGKIILRYLQHNLPLGLTAPQIRGNDRQIIMPKQSFGYYGLDLQPRSGIPLDDTMADMYRPGVTPYPFKTKILWVDIGRDML